jgi:Fic family protein
MEYTDKYAMTVAECVFLAKRNLVDYVYHSAKLEGCNVTFPETQTILDGVNVGSVTLDDIQTILNLRDAWRFVLSDLKTPFNLEYICGINGYVSRNESLSWGKLRTGNVGISGTDYRPALPEADEVSTALERLDAVVCVTERAIDVFLWGCRSQLFWDGNKRTSALAANAVLIRNGAGIFSVREKHLLEFNRMLLDYYNTGNSSTIKPFLYETAILGLDDGVVNDEQDRD